MLRIQLLNYFIFYFYFYFFYVTQGRPYEEKMKWDRIEMLYWLQEERKQNAIKYEAMMRHVPYKVKTAQLEPIPMI